MKITTISREETTHTNGSMTVGVILDTEGRNKRRLWYRFPAAYAHFLSNMLDPFVIGALFTAMRERTDLVVHGSVSPSLLRNLEEFQAAWVHWKPDLYGRITITADREQETSSAGTDAGAIAAFSGGVDAAFTVYRHVNGLAGRLERKITAGMMVHGFDIFLEQEAYFARAAEKGARMLSSLGIDLIPVSTNIRELGANWNDSHGAAVASCLMLLGGGCNAGLIASTEPYRSLILPWGSNPVTDPLLSSGAFPIIHDGAAFTRSEKIRLLAEWPEALENLRVCWQGEHLDRNCGKCEKCIRTILNFRVMGFELPGCFEQDATDRDIRSLTGLTPVPIAYLTEILEAARAASIDDSWVKALETCIERNRRASRGWRKKLRETRNRLSFGTRLRRLLSGSPDAGST